MKAKTYSKMSLAVDHLIDLLGKDIRLAAPLGLGKPNQLLNLIYERVKDDPSLSLKIYTALSLNPPNADSDFAKRFLEEFKNRQWGRDYPTLQYAVDSIDGRLPPNIKVHEFYFQAGAALKSEGLQRDYQSINYTHVAETVLQYEIQVIVQLIAKKSHSEGTSYSLSCNPDLTLDVVKLYKKFRKSLVVVGVVHPDLPFLGGEAEVSSDFFDVIVESQEVNHQLFSLPKTLVNEADHAIGFFASQLVPDDGTLQIGIGSLSDAVVSSLIFRQKNNNAYSELVEKSWKAKHNSSPHLIHKNNFEIGLYGLSEMITDGFMHLRRAGILIREVIDELSQTKTYMHGAFYLGSKEFYSWLRDLKGEDYAGLRMGPVSKVNDLYDPNELLLRRQRKNARFINTCMEVTLLGGAASETLEDGRVVSGVGGQYNFVSMSLELENSRSILMLRSWRRERGKRRSNIVWAHGQLTIPRHLRDIVVTEYGIADIRGKTDEETICELLKIADSEFQEGLVKTAKKNKKLSKDYVIPEFAQNNSPENLTKFVQGGRQKGTFLKFPFGSDFTPEEDVLVAALEKLKNSSNFRLFQLLLIGMKTKDGDFFQRELKRMKLDAPKNLKERLSKAILLGALKEL